MRIQNLAVVFVIIILPITLVLQAYIRNLTNVTNIEARYNEILMGSTYDAVRAYQMNTINNDYSGVNTSRQRDVKASVNSFFNSLATGLRRSGSTRASMNEYVPALLFNLYDGFYVYGPYNNVASVGSDNDGDNQQDATGPGENQVDNKRPFFNENVQNTENTIYGIKPFTYYSCKYTSDQYDITINYTLDNYIAVAGTVKDEDGNSVQISGAGYYIDGASTTTVGTVREFLVNSITGSGDTVTNSAGVQIKAEQLGEYVSFYDRVYIQLAGNTKPKIASDMNGAVYARYYKYINYNNVKYYFDDYMNTSNTTCTSDAPPIFTVKNHMREYISLDQLITLANYQGWRLADGSLVTKDEGYVVAKEFSKQIRETAGWADVFYRDVNPYYYYKKAKIFSDEMYPYLKQIDLGPKNADGNISVIKNSSFNEKYAMTVRTGEQVSNDSYKITDYKTKRVFDYSDKTNNPELDSSAFNAHRMDVIAKTIESSLIKTISSLNDYYGSNSFIYEMPTISMEDWNSISNGITVAAFMQGVPIGNYKFFNNYCIIGNTTNKEFVSKDAIYIQPKYGESRVAKMNEGGVDTKRTAEGESGFIRKLSYMNLPTQYSTQCVGYNVAEPSKVLTQHNPRCGELMSSTDTDFIAYRRNDYLVESYEHTYDDYRIGPAYSYEGVSGKAAWDGYNEVDTEHKFHWEETTKLSVNGMWYYKNGIYVVNGYNSGNTNQKKYATALHYDGGDKNLHLTYVQQINYYPQCGANAYECIISHNGYKYTYDQVLSNDADAAGITDPAEKEKFKSLSAAYATCLAREKEAQYKSLEPMNYHRIYMYDRDGSLLSIATRTSGEEVGVVAFKGKENSEWLIGYTKEIPTNYTMPYHDIKIYYKKTDGHDVFGK